MTADPAAPLSFGGVRVATKVEPAVLIPHYVIDARPVSYEPPPPFSF